MPHAGAPAVGDTSETPYAFASKVSITKVLEKYKVKYSVLKKDSKKNRLR